MNCYCVIGFDEHGIDGFLRAVVWHLQDTILCFEYIEWYTLEGLHC